MRTKGWFGRKLVGFGIGPRTWEGAAVIVVFAAGFPVLLGWAAPQIAAASGLAEALIRLALIAAWVGALAGVIVLTCEES
ncbi:MAG: hypothetical protein JNJ73_21615 [Hyphomonadaceae bacterium]|nr:hypothetical protein [Hyphomonadaceae bacterium]